MTITADERPVPVPSVLDGLRDMPLSRMAELPAGVLDEAVRRVLPETPSVPVAAFNSAI